MKWIKMIFEAQSVLVECFDHVEHYSHTDDRAELTQSIAATFVEHGDFELVERNQRWSFGRFEVLLSSPRVTRKYHHHSECPADICLTLSYSPVIVGAES